MENLKRKRVNYVGNYDIDRSLKMGEIKSIRSNGGATLNSLELLFSPTTIAKFYVNRATNKVDFLIDNVDLKYQDLSCSLSKNVLKDLYIYIRDLYNELESEETTQ